MCVCVCVFVCVCGFVCLCVCVCMLARAPVCVCMLVRARVYVCVLGKGFCTAVCMIFLGTHMWCLGRILPLLIGNGKKYFLQLLTIVDFMFASALTRRLPCNGNSGFPCRL